ncbi:MAG: twin-arginine translocase TatA/TatE family subunit [Flavobacteriales bacterium]|nr:twin-arginine translocase TatA/TatE family subunit [Flavobacteriales bacterium]|tara:strand:- start:64907 stop:65155 length:249 start_codon:yes stop_codon:yes gene_type:complete
MVLGFLSLGGSEIFIVLLAVVLLFGSKKIPELARGFGKGIREFKNATGDIQEEIRKTSREITDRANPDKKTGGTTQQKSENK